MRSRLAALVAACFVVATCQPRLGLVVHRHAGGGHLHVHLDGAAGAPAGLSAHGDHHHDGATHPHLADHRHGDGAPVAVHDERMAYRAAPPSTRSELIAGTFAFAWHTHGTQPFQRVAPATPPALASPQAAERLAVLPPPHRGAAEPIPGRSRAPPSAQSS